MVPSDRREVRLGHIRHQHRRAGPQRLCQGRARACLVVLGELAHELLAVGIAVNGPEYPRLIRSADHGHDPPVGDSGNGTRDHLAQGCLVVQGGGHPAYHGGEKACPSAGGLRLLARRLGRSAEAGSGTPSSKSPRQPPARNKPRAAARQPVAGHSGRRRRLPFDAAIRLWASRGQDLGEHPLELRPEVRQNLADPTAQCSSTATPFMAASTSLTRRYRNSLSQNPNPIGASANSASSNAESAARLRSESTQVDSIGSDRPPAFMAPRALPPVAVRKPRRRNRADLGPRPPWRPR